MQHYWVGFEYYTRTEDGINEGISPHTWAEANSPEEAEKVARHRLRDKMPPGLEMQLCVPFSDEDYAKEVARIRRIEKDRGRDEKLN